MAAPIGVQRRFKGKSLLRAKPGMRPDKFEIADFAAAEEPTDFLHVFASMCFEPRQYLRISGRGKGGNLREHGVTQESAGLLQRSVESPGHLRDDAGLGEQPQDLAERPVAETRLLEL